MNLKEFSSYDGLGLAELVKSKEVKAEELIELSVKAVEELNPQLNSVVHLVQEQALNDLKHGNNKGDFAGVPIFIKEVGCFAKDLPSSMGSRLSEGYIYPFDSHLIKNFRKAGFSILGTTTTPEFGFNATTESVLYGPTHNPWKLGHSSGGSSGGASSTVASGIAPIAHGNDAGGSIRIPASCTGLVGLKPSRGRVSEGPLFAQSFNGLAVEFGLTKSIRDTAYLLDAVSQPEPGEYCYAPKPVKPYKELIALPVRKLRIAWTSKSITGASVSKEVLQALHRTVHLLESLGHELVEAAPSYDADAFSRATIDVWSSNIYAQVQAITDETGKVASEDNIESAIWKCYLKGKEMKASQLLQAIEINHSLTQTVGQFFLGYDLFLTPTIAEEPIKHGVLNSNHPTMKPNEFFQLMLMEIAPFTALFNTTGQPAISLPLQMSKNGLPIGMQFVGKYGDEATLLQLGVQLEEVINWRNHIPTIHASKV